MNRYVVNIARNDAAITVRQPGLYVMFVVIPALVTSFLVPTYGALLQERGYASANGSELVVPGMMVMFGFFGMSFAGYSVLDEYKSETWTRLRALPARPLDVLVGKTITPLVVILAQQAVLLSVGVVVFDMAIRGPLVALAAVGAAFGLVIAGLGVAVVALARTAQQVSLVSNLSLLVLGGLGSSFAPPDLMPGWTRAAARATPGYWAIEAFRGVILDGDGLGEVTGAIAVLLAWALVAAAFGVTRFRRDAARGRLP